MGVQVSPRAAGMTLSFPRAKRSELAALGYSGSVYLATSDRRRLTFSTIKQQGAQLLASRGQA
jgi:hypothetical protein